MLTLTGQPEITAHQDHTNVVLTIDGQEAVLPFTTAYDLIGELTGIANRMISEARKKHPSLRDGGEAYEIAYSNTLSKWPGHDD